MTLENLFTRLWEIDQAVQALIRDRSGRQRRGMTGMEHDGFAHFLLEHGDVLPAGLTVRERGRQI